MAAADTRAVALPLGTLTDAELAVLARPGTRVGPRPVMPVWSRLDPDQRTASVRDARASLLARRLLDPETPARRGVRRDLRSVLALREAAAVVVAVARVDQHGHDHWYAHVVRDVLLLEHVSADGVHRFALAAAATLPHLVVAAVLHPDAPIGSAATEAPVVVETGWLRADVALRSAGSTRRLAWVSSPRGTWCATPGDAAAPCSPVAPAVAGRLLRDDVAALVRGQAEDGR